MKNNFRILISSAIAFSITLIIYFSILMNLSRESYQFLYDSFFNQFEAMPSNFDHQISIIKLFFLDVTYLSIFALSIFIFNQIYNVDDERLFYERNYYINKTLLVILNSLIFLGAEAIILTSYNSIMGFNYGLFSPLFIIFERGIYHI